MTRFDSGLAAVLSLALCCLSCSEDASGDGGSSGGGNGGTGGAAANDGSGGSSPVGGQGGSNGIALIGPEGGVVDGGRGVTVTIPAGALVSETEIAAKVVDSAGLPLRPPGINEVGRFVELTPHGTLFATPVAVTLPYESASDNLTVLRIDDESDTTWEQLDGASFDSGTATVGLSRFSILAVAEIGTDGSGPGNCSPCLATGTCASCESSADCSLSEYCAKDKCDEPGVCLVEPTSCPAGVGGRVEPVCGCDGRIYDAPAEAASNGASVSVTGIEACTCSDDSECPENFPCLPYFAAAAAVRVPSCDATLACLRPTSFGGGPDEPECPPACGCDGATYECYLYTYIGCETGVEEECVGIAENSTCE